MVNLQVHLRQGLLHVLDMGGRILEQTLALTYIRPQLGDLTFGPKAGAQQTVRMKPLQPLRITDVGFASGHVLGIARIDEKNCKATGIEEFEDRNPVDARGLHDDRLDTTFCKPVHHPMQIGREGPEAAHRLRRTICAHGSHVHGRPDVDRSCVRVNQRHCATDLVGRSVLTHLQSSSRGRKGWAALSINFLNGITERRHHSQARNSPWTKFFYGVTCHQKLIGRSLPLAV